MSSLSCVVSFLFALRCIFHCMRTWFVVWEQHCLSVMETVTKRGRVLRTVNWAGAIFFPLYLEFVRNFGSFRCNFLHKLLLISDPDISIYNVLLFLGIRPRQDSVFKRLYAKGTSWKRGSNIRNNTVTFCLGKSQKMLKDAAARPLCTLPNTHYCITFLDVEEGRKCNLQTTFMHLIRPD